MEEGGRGGGRFILVVVVRPPPPFWAASASCKSQGTRATCCGRRSSSAPPSPGSSPASPSILAAAIELPRAPQPPSQGFAAAPQPPLAAAIEPPLAILPTARLAPTGTPLQDNRAHVGPLCSRFLGWLNAALRIVKGCNQIKAQLHGQVIGDGADGDLHCTFGRTNKDKTTKKQETRLQSRSPSP